MDPDLPPKPFALFFDVDGTLIDIAQTPDGVVVPSALIAGLRRAARALDGALALVSGRTIADLDSLFAPLRLRASGVHGAEVRFDPEGPIDGANGDALPVAVIDALRVAAAPFEGTIVEDKHYSAALHYRQNPNAAPVLRGAIEKIVEAHESDGLRLLPGHMVFEIKRATFDKGSAIGRFMGRAPFAGRLPVFLGDDITDQPGFDAVMKLGGLAYSVGQHFPGLSGSFPDPASVRHWLAGLATSEARHA